MRIILLENDDIIHENADQAIYATLAHYFFQHASGQVDTAQFAVRVLGSARDRDLGRRRDRDAPTRPTRRDASTDDDRDTTEGPKTKHEGETRRGARRRARSPRTTPSTREAHEISHFSPSLTGR